MKITEVGDGLFQFKFSMESQLNWVINNGPWSFDNHILLLRRWEKGMTAFSVKFLTIPIWVPVWGLPFDLTWIAKLLPLIRQGSFESKWRYR